MLRTSQPITAEAIREPAAESKSVPESMTEENIKSQRIGDWFDDFLDDGRRRIKLTTRIQWLWMDLTYAFRNFKRAIRNHAKWHKTMKKLYPWAGDSGLFEVMQTHLQDYILYEEKFGHSLEEYKNNKIATAKETLALLERMGDPDEYTNRRIDEVESRYPKYGSHVIEYQGGGSSSGGDFVAQGNGWVGIEAGSNPREGYFEFVDGKFELAPSPDQPETERLLEELRQYHNEIQCAFRQAENDSDNDFDRLNQLLKENLYSWWD
jgi:hypothetical protein